MRISRAIGDYALLFEAIYLVRDDDYVTFMDAQQAINLRLLDEFARRGIDARLPDDARVQRDGATAAGRKAALKPRPLRKRPFANRDRRFIEAYAALRLASPHSHPGDTAS